uniref:Uncharacterized protein n=1 Tax=Anguilla anguilla TaxID=7936 RepID=A0A0E9P7N1_ANGAN
MNSSVFPLPFLEKLWGGAGGRRCSVWWNFV